MEYDVIFKKENFWTLDILIWKLCRKFYIKMLKSWIFEPILGHACIIMSYLESLAPKAYEMTPKTCSYLIPVQIYADLKKQNGRRRHLGFDQLVPHAHHSTRGFLLRTPWATSVPNFSSSHRKKRTFISSILFGGWLGNYDDNWCCSGRYGVRWLNG